VIDTATQRRVVTIITVGNGPAGVAVTPSGGHTYVTNMGSSTVSVIDTATNAVKAMIPVMAGPALLAVTRRAVAASIWPIIALTDCR
jgi:YVTN family beta-propeller protein